MLSFRKFFEARKVYSGGTERSLIYAAIAGLKRNDIVPLLIYADWADDNGMVGISEFIRVSDAWMKIKRQWIDALKNRDMIAAQEIQKKMQAIDPVVTFQKVKKYIENPEDGWSYWGGDDWRPIGRDNYSIRLSASNFTFFRIVRGLDRASIPIRHIPTGLLRAGLLKFMMANYPAGKLEKIPQQRLPKTVQPQQQQANSDEEPKVPTTQQKVSSNYNYWLNRAIFR